MFQSVIKHLIYIFIIITFAADGASEERKRLNLLKNNTGKESKKRKSNIIYLFYIEVAKKIYSFPIVSIFVCCNNWFIDEELHHGVDDGIHLNSILKV